jgi:FKBP-type peptidyl-prolyl cis-trans isomerase FkpA
VTSTIVPLLRNAAVIAIVIVSATFVSGCSDGTPVSPAPIFSQTDLRAGSGIPALAGYKVSVYYTGWLYDPTRPEGKGLQFETNVGAETPLTFTLGVGQVIAGWDSGILNQRVGGLRLLVIPASLAYGGIRSGPIPAHAALVFEVDLISAEAQ